MSRFEPPEPAPREPVRDPDEGWDDRDAALAHQQQLERRHDEEQRILASDPGYLKWLDDINEQLTQTIFGEGQ